MRNPNRVQENVQFLLFLLILFLTPTGRLANQCLHYYNLDVLVYNASACQDCNPLQEIILEIAVVD